MQIIFGRAPTVLPLILTGYEELISLFHSSVHERRQSADVVQWVPISVRPTGSVGGLVYFGGPHRCRFTVSGLSVGSNSLGQTPITCC